MIHTSGLAANPLPSPRSVPLAGLLSASIGRRLPDSSLLIANGRRLEGVLCGGPLAQDYGVLTARARALDAQQSPRLLAYTWATTATRRCQRCCCCHATTAAIHPATIHPARRSSPSRGPRQTSRRGPKVERASSRLLPSRHAQLALQQ